MATTIVREAFPIGSRVVIHSFHRAPQWNGATGVVTGYSASGLVELVPEPRRPDLYDGTPWRMPHTHLKRDNCGFAEWARRFK